MKSKYGLILFATIFAIVFTALAYLIPEYKMMWLSLEVIILPIIYAVGYEKLMDEQKRKFGKSLNVIKEKLDKMNLERKILEEKIKGKD